MTPQRHYRLGDLQLAILKVLWTAGPGSVAAVRKALRRRRPAYTTVATVLRRMEADGLIIRRPNVEDRRISDVYLSENGARSFREMAADHARWMSDIFGVLGEDETEQLVRLLGRIRERIDERIDKDEND